MIRYMTELPDRPLLSLEEAQALIAHATPGPYRAGQVRTYGIYADAYTLGGRQGVALATVTHWPGEREPAEPVDAHNLRLLAASHDLALTVIALYGELSALRAAGAQPGQTAGRDEAGA